MASSSSSYQQNNVFSGIEPDSERRVVCESSKLYDVFINHRGPDVKQTLATQLYNSLEQLGIRAFLDSEEKQLGNSFPSIIETAIRSASAHIAIFSKRYAHSPWCLAELVLMLQSQAKIIPVFYEVEPWELRHIEKGVYNDAFINYQEKGRYLDKLPQWKEALYSLSFIAGEEFNSFNDCKSIVAAVQKEVRRKQSLHVAIHPVGLDYLVKDFERRCLDELVQDFENQCVLQKRRDKAKANVVGIFGMGGAGKTTLAKELFNRKSSDYCRASFLFDVREASVRSDLPSLQLKLLKDLFNEDHGSFTSIEEGTSSLKDNLRRSPLLNFLIVLDDIDHVEQLDALLVMDILNKFGNILAIITTRDVGVLIAAGITVGYHLKGMDRNDGRQLFCWHSFGQLYQCSGYEVLVEDFLDVCGGLPLSLQVLGRHVCGRDHSYWSSELIKVRKTLPRDVMKRLKISFDALDGEEKQVFMDIACFFVGKRKSIADRVWEGSGWNAQRAGETLQDKCLVSLEKHSFLNDELIFRMHDHLRDLGREMALAFGHPHRLWRPQHLALTGFKDILAKENVRCFHSIEDESMGCRVSFFIGQSDIFVGTSSSLLCLQLEGNRKLKEQPSLPSWVRLQSLQFFPSSIPSWVPLQSLQCLYIIDYGQLKTFWKNHRQVPSHLKELMIYKTSLKELPDLFRISDSSENGGKSCSVKAPLSDLEKLEISGEKFLTKILINGFHYTSLESIKLHCIENLREVNLTRVRMLSCLDITNCEKLKGLKGTSDLTNLVLLNISRCPNLEFEYLCLRGMKCLERITFDKDVKVKCFQLDGCQILKTIEFDYKGVVNLSIHDCPELDKLPVFCGPSCLESIIVDECEKFEYLRFISCQNLRSVTGKIELRQLYIRDCPKLEELLTLSRQSQLERFEIYNCEKLQTINLSGQSCRNLSRVAGTSALTKITNLYIDGCQNLKSVAGNFELKQLNIRDCPELEELPSLSRLSCLENFKIYNCNKLQSITLPTTVISLSVKSCRGLRRVAGTRCDLTKITNLDIDGCQNLKSVSGDFELRKLYISDCPELEELPTLSRQSHLKEFVINSCEKVENIAGIGELHVSKHMQLSYLSNAAIRNCLAKLQSVPSQFVCVIDVAVDAAEATFNQFLFSQGRSAIQEIDVFRYISCFVVVVENSTSVENVNRALSDYNLCDFRRCLSGGGKIITMVDSGDRSAHIGDALRRYGMLKNWHTHPVTRNEWWKIWHLIATILRQTSCN